LALSGSEFAKTPFLVQGVPADYSNKELKKETLRGVFIRQFKILKSELSHLTNEKILRARSLRKSSLKKKAK